MSSIVKSCCLRLFWELLPRRDHDQSHKQSSELKIVLYYVPNSFKCFVEHVFIRCLRCPRRLEKNWSIIIKSFKEVPKIFKAWRWLHLLMIKPINILFNIFFKSWKKSPSCSDLVYKVFLVAVSFEKCSKLLKCYIEVTKQMYLQQIWLTVNEKFKVSSLTLSGTCL